MATYKDALYLTKDIRLCERMAIDECGLSEDELMARAGRKAFDSLKQLYKNVQTIAVFCGSGNNAGDGYVLARLACLEGFSVIVYQYKGIDELPDAARHAATQAMAAGVSCHCLDDNIDSDVDLIVDALLGIGLSGDVNDIIAQAIDVMNSSGLPIIALDIPSGLNADTGKKHGACTEADVTITFIGPKVGLYTLDGPDHSGQIICHTLQLEQCLKKIPSTIKRLENTCLQELPKRKKNSHKGLFGHVLIIGGNIGMPGAVYLAAQSALRIGAGMVTIATRPEHAQTVLPGLPEAMIFPVTSGADLIPLLTKATICVIGPGLGECKWAKSLFTAAIASQLPFVIDASALRMLADNPQHDDNWVLTPHPGEAASLLGSCVETIQANRLASAQRIQQQYGGCVVLKGVGTIVQSEGDVSICTAGNPGMATAGMGDVLSGVIAGLFSQGLSLADASKIGVLVHANAADAAAIASGERGLVASDLMLYLRKQVNSLN